MFRLLNHHKHILSVLSTDGGFTTGDVARRAGDADNPPSCLAVSAGHSPRMRSAAVRAWLLELENAGMVRRLDDQKPVCWVRVEPRSGDLA